MAKITVKPSLTEHGERYRYSAKEVDGKWVVLDAGGEVAEEALDEEETWQVAGCLTDTEAGHDGPNPSECPLCGEEFTRK
ncbi:MAG TPA: hypothetical protein VMT20_19600 [Terriglobia bacterium]|nr:hypothetical protein [Terriglobia bacterium]